MAKKKTPVTPSAKKSRKATKPDVATVEIPTGDTPAVEVTATGTSVVEVPAALQQVPPADEAETPVVLEVPQQSVVEEPTAQRASEAPALETGPPASEAPATSETTLRFWQVRRGPEIVGRTQAGTEEWALKQARKQFGEDVTVEPGVEAPAPAPKDRSKGKKEADKDPTKLSALDAAAKVLGEAGQPMTCQELIGAMAAKGYWSSPAGKTPAATLYSAMLREATTKGDQARFIKADRGKFTLRPQV
jgi:hypothetical protein